MSILIIVCGFQVIKGESVVLFLFKKIWQILLLDSEQKSWSDRMHQRNLTAQCHACGVFFLRTSDHSGLTVCCWWLLCFFGTTLEHWNWTESGGYFLISPWKRKERSTFQSVSSARDTHTHHRMRDLRRSSVFAWVSSWFLKKDQKALYHCLCAHENKI